MSSSCKQYFFAIALHARASWCAFYLQFMIWRNRAYVVQSNITILYHIASQTSIFNPLCMIDIYNASTSMCFFCICNVVIWNSIYSIHIYNRILGPEWERKPLWGETVRKELSPLFWKLRHIRSSNRTAFTSTLCLHCQVFTANLCLFASSFFQFWQKCPWWHILLNLITTYFHLYKSWCKGC